MNQFYISNRALGTQFFSTMINNINDNLQRMGNQSMLEFPTNKLRQQVDKDFFGFYKHQ